VAELITDASVRRARKHNNGRRRAPAGAAIGKAMAASGRKHPIRIPEVVLGVVLVAGCALAALLWQRSNGAATTVVVAAHPIARGTVITPADLVGEQVAGNASAFVAGPDAHQLLDRVALIDIEGNSPLTASMFADEVPLAEGEALTSVALTRGQFPSDLATEDRVRIVVTTPVDATGQTTTTMLDEDAIVWSVQAAPDGVSTVVTVRGPIGLTTSIASAAKVQLATVEGR